LLDVLRTVKSVCNRKRKISLEVYEIKDCHSGVPEDSGFLRSDDVSLDEDSPCPSEDDGITTTASPGNTRLKTQLQNAEGSLTSSGFMQQYNFDITGEE